jgi:hypothetical protein
LGVAVKNGHIGAVKALLEAGANKDAKSHLNLCPSFKDHFLSPSAKPDRYDSQLLSSLCHVPSSPHAHVFKISNSTLMGFLFLFFWGGGRARTRREQAGPRAARIPLQRVHERVQVGLRLEAVVLRRLDAEHDAELGIRPLHRRATTNRVARAPRYLRLAPTPAQRSPL